MLINLLEGFIGFSGGVVVGAGFVAFITILKVIPRLIQLSKTQKFIKVYAGSIICGVLFGTFLSFSDVNLQQPNILLLFWGLLHGIFNGMLAAALAEVLNVFPILFKRIGIQERVQWLLMAVVFGKVIGSLFQWTYFVTRTNFL